MIDAHQHFWRIDRGDYRWLTPELAAIHRDFLPPDLEPLLAEAGIASTILVQASDTDAETDFLLDLAAETTFVSGVVGWVDFAARSAPDRLGRLADDPRFVGVRPMIQDLPDPDWMLREELRPALEALVELDLAFDAIVRPLHLPRLRMLLDRHPELRVVVDHAAKPTVAEGWSGFGEWREHMEAIARESSACCKLSGLATEARPGWTAEDLRPYADVVLEAFGPSRLVWGSDWPVVVLAGGYAQWWEATAALLADLSAEDRRAVLGGNAARLYRIGERAAA
jgi:L-fuconolactonase